MATKRGSSKKSATKKSSKKPAKKSSKKTSKKAGATFPPPNLACIEMCVARYDRCLSKGVDPALCRKRLVRCLQHCSIYGTPGPDEG
ncbi:MAG TPA: hypothetical protein VFA21_03095 [Pyrinomonadaceae bacterium]|nr:hypothetical protein [Pyrinomonadaceae bacterium]